MTLNLEELNEAMVYFSSIQCQSLTENCIVALESHDHKSKCSFELYVDDELVKDVDIEWSSNVIKNGYKEPKKYTEKGAEALSFLLAVNFTAYNVVEEAIIGTGIDYWLGYEETHEKYDESNFIQARLEVSGILSESKTNTITSRVKSKKNQTTPTDETGLPVYVSIVEFSKPQAYFGKK